ncbi:alpha/beta hydrolase [Pseudomonas sp. R2.Fl]|nr:alpha/beta hydrolase [Pseudomonas sp. R2.Fl]
MFSETRRFSSPSGALLAYHHKKSVGPGRAVVLVCHGMIEHSRRYEPFALALAERGFHVLAHDHRGHGETTAIDAPLGRFAHRSGADLVIEDVLAMRELALSEYPDLPVILFGHSMGGLIALNAANAEPGAFAGLAVWNSNFNAGLSGHFARFVLAVERMLKGSDVPSSILPKATFGAWGKSIEGRTSEFDWLSRDPDMVARYATDPLCRFDASVSMWMDVLELTQRPFRNGRIHALARAMPIHLVGGGKDPATRGGRDVRWLAQRLAAADFWNVTLRIYDDMRHETLNEIGRERAIEDFGAWLDGIIKAPALA